MVYGRYAWLEWYCEQKERDAIIIGLQHYAIIIGWQKIIIG